MVSFLGRDEAGSGADRGRAVPVRLRIGGQEIEAYEVVGALSQRGPAAADAGAPHDMIRSLLSRGVCAVVHHDPALVGGGHVHHFLDCIGGCAGVSLALLGVADAAGAWLVGPQTTISELCSVCGVPATRITQSHPVTDDFGRFSHLWNGSVRASKAEGPRSLGTSIGRAFGELHGSGVVHGDARGDNIIVNDDGKLTFLGSMAEAKFVCPSAPSALFATDLVHVLESMTPDIWQAFREHYTQQWPDGRRVVEFIESSGHSSWQAAIDAGNFLDGLKRIDEILATRHLNGLERMTLLTGKGECLARLGRPTASAGVCKEALQLAIKEHVPDDATDPLRYTLAVSLSMAGDDAAALSILTALMAKARKGLLDPELRQFVEDSIEGINSSRVNRIRS